MQIRTAELRSEIESRNRIATFNAGRNQLLEKVAEGQGLDEVLTHLAQVMEHSVPECCCMIMLDRAHSRSIIRA